MEDIDWFPWSSDAFNRAQAEDKLVLLDISASWCHWCHVMDESTYSNDDVVELINQNFIPIRVDTDRRPDINSRYNMGGWPTTAILTPEGDLVTGTTYLPPEEMKSFLQRVDALKETGIPEEHIFKAEEQDLPEGKVNEAVGLYRSWLEELYDEANGGFGDRPKFPQPEVYGLLFLLAEDKGWEDRLVMTLQRLAGGLLDEDDGGLYRYATQRDWSEPHYEKLTLDNSRLARTYARAYVKYGKELFNTTVEKTVNWLTTTMYGDDHFYGSQDAAEDYYHATTEERKGMEKPRVDETLYTDVNAAAVSALLDASMIMGEPDYREKALHVLEKLLETVDGETPYHSYPKASDTPSTLMDSVYLLEALINAYQHTLDKQWLFHATNVADAACATFGSNGALWDVASTEEHGLMKVRQKNPDDNGAAAKVLMKLSALTGEEKYHTVAEKALNELAGLVQAQESFAPRYVEACILHERGFIEVDVNDAPELQRAALADLDERVLVKEGEEEGATVCINKTCHGPFEEASELLDKLEELR